MRIRGAAGESYTLCAEDVGCRVRAVLLDSAGETPTGPADVLSSTAVAPLRSMLQLLQAKLEGEGMHSFRVYEPEGRALTLRLTPKRVELLDEPTGEAAQAAAGGSSGWAARRRDSKAVAGKAAVVQSEAACHPAAGCYWHASKCSSGFFGRFVVLVA